MKPAFFEIPRSEAERDGLVRAVRSRLRPPGDLVERVAEILRDVRARGDEALVEYARRFDGASLRLRDLYVPREELAGAGAAIPEGVRVALERLRGNVEAVARAELRGPVEVELEQGQRVTLSSHPVERCGIYVPGGRAAYPTTAVMCAVPARVAGVREIVVATPCDSSGAVPSSVMAACSACGVDSVLRVGGAHAVAALAFGTESVPAVDVVVGPGNAFVQEAKRQVTGTVGLDGIAGPSELAVVLDRSADVRWVALDLCAQAEHGPDSLCVAISAEREVLEAVERERRSIASTSPSVRSAPAAYVVAVTTAEAIDFADRLAPEHLELAIEDSEGMASGRRAPCVYVGASAATAFGDYMAGSNHVLPTGAAARFSGPLSPRHFQRETEIVRVPAEAAARMAHDVGVLARAEGFEVHALSAEARARARVSARERE